MFGFEIFRDNSGQLARAKDLADAMAEKRGHVVYVVKLCDNDYHVTSQVPDRYEYKAKP